jgi:arylsulfatase A-like enzyme
LTESKGKSKIKTYVYTTKQYKRESVMRNIVLLTIDTLRKDMISSYRENNLTAFIDSIKDKSIRFNNAYSGGPYTQAAFPGILSSTYYLDFGRQKGRCPAERVLISEVLSKSGIKIAAIHSNPYLCDFFGWNKGWDYFYDSMEADVKLGILPLRLR